MFLLDEGLILEKGSVYEDKKILSPSHLPKHGKRVFVLFKNKDESRWPETSVHLEDGEELYYCITREVRYPYSTVETACVSVGVKGRSKIFLFENGEVNVCMGDVENVHDDMIRALKLQHKVIDNG